MLNRKHFIVLVFILLLLFSLTRNISINSYASAIKVKLPSKIPDTCLECSELATCPFPDLMAYLKDLVHQKFHGNIVIPFKDGMPGKIKKEEIVDFQKS